MPELDEEELCCTPLLKELAVSPSLGAFNPPMRFSEAAKKVSTILVGA